MATVTLLWHGDSTGGAYSNLIGSPTFTLAGGETLVMMFNGLSTSDQGVPTDSAGTIVKQTAAYNAWNSSSNGYGGFLTEVNAAAGSHTITPPTVVGGSFGMMMVWKVTGMPSTLQIRAAAAARQINASNIYSLTAQAPSLPQPGDIVFGIRFHENSTGSTDAIVQPRGWTSDAQYLNGSVNLPTDGSHFVVTKAGPLNAVWVDIDPAITDTEGAILVLVPAAPTINTQPADTTVAEGTQATFSVSATASSGSLSYQWQDTSGDTFANISGATSASLTVMTQRGMDRRLYRVNVTDSNGTTTSSSASLFVRSITAAWPPQQIPLLPPFKRARSALWLLDVGNWGSTPLDVAKWFAPELTTATGSNPNANINVSDSAAGTDSASIAAAETAADSGAGTDTGTVAAAFPLADSGAGSDAVVAAPSITPTDSSTGSDGTSLAAALGASDAAAGTDAGTPAVALALADSAAGTDGVVVDAITAIAAADSATGTDSASLAAAIDGADSGAGSDGISVDTGGTPITASDSATGTEAVALAAGIAGAETGAGSDTPSTAVALTPTDSSSGTDQAALNAAAGISDSGSGTEAGTLAAAITGADSASATDGIAVDTGTPDANLDLVDSAIGSDLISVEQSGGLVLGGRVNRRKWHKVSDAAIGVDSIVIERIRTPARRTAAFVVLQRDMFADPVVEFGDSAQGQSDISVYREYRDRSGLVRSTPKATLRRSTDATM